MVSASLLAGGTLYIGYKTYRTATGAARPAWWQRLMTSLHNLRTQVTQRYSPPYATKPLIDILLCPTPPAQHHLAAATTALGAATVGTLYYPPLRLACIPAFLYLGVAPARSAYLIWCQEGRMTPVVAEGALLALCLVQGQFLVGSACLSLYYLGQVMTEAKYKEQEELVAWQLPRWAWRQSPDGLVATPVCNLQVGNTIVIHAGEMIPIAGVVAHGVAWVRMPHHAHDPFDENSTSGVKISAGYPVECATIVLIGTITVTTMALP